MVVSLDENGYVFTGAGTTISQNVTVAELGHADDVDDVRVCAWDTNIIFTGSKGMLVAYEISYDDIPINNNVYRLPTVNNEPRLVQGLFKVGDNTLAVVGSGQILPVRVTVTDTSGGKAASFDITFDPGEATTFADDGASAYPYCDELRDEQRRDMIACTYEKDHTLYTNVFTLNDNGVFEGKGEVAYGKARQYHGLAGCGPVGYVVAAVGADWDSEMPVGPISVAYAEVREDRIQVGEFQNLTMEYSVGFFALDNLYMNGAVMCYNRLASGGIDCVGLDVTYGQGGRVLFGSTLRLSTGGSAIMSARSKVLVINRRTFGVLYANDNVGGSISLQMVTFNDAGDMKKNGPAYVVSQHNRWERITNHIVGTTYVDDYKSAIVELTVGRQSRKAYLHTVYVYPRPIGIAAKTFAGGNQVQFGGLWSPNSKQMRGGRLLPGFMYYTNDRGMIITGWNPAGYAHSSFGTFYITSRSDESLLSTSNQVGIAISETEILLKFA